MVTVGGCVSFYAWHHLPRAHFLFSQYPGVESFALFRPPPSHVTVSYSTGPQGIWELESVEQKQPLSAVSLIPTFVFEESEASLVKCFMETSTAQIDLDWLRKYTVLEGKVACITFFQQLSIKYQFIK